MIEGRVVLEKIKLLESKMRYQIEKLIQLAAVGPSDEKVINGQPPFARAIALSHIVRGC
jgi:hypothetical protein